MVAPGQRTGVWKFGLPRVLVIGLIGRVKVARLPNLELWQDRFA